MSLSKRIRFEVFKRDGFACQYCGKKAPDVILHVDHVVPRAKGGGDEIINLVTACDACNLGKGAVPLADSSAVAKQRAQMEQLQERQEQIQMLIDWHRELAGQADHALDEIADYWCEIADWGGVSAAGKQTLAKIIRKYGISEAMESMRIAADQYFQFEGQSGKPTSESTERAFRKLGGICSVRAAGESKPYLKDLFYVRGILRNRVNSGDIGYWNDREGQRLLDLAFSLGADANEMKRIARDCSSWSRWRDSVSEYIAELGGDASG